MMSSFFIYRNIDVVPGLTFSCTCTKHNIHRFPNRHTELLQMHALVTFRAELSLSLIIFIINVIIINSMQVYIHCYNMSVCVFVDITIYDYIESQVLCSSASAFNFYQFTTHNCSVLSPSLSLFFFFFTVCRDGRQLYSCYVYLSRTPKELNVSKCSGEQ